MISADSAFPARWAATVAFVSQTREAASTPASVATRLTEHCVHGLGLAGATVLLLDPAMCTVGLVETGDREAALAERLVAAGALAHEVLRRGSSRFIEQPGRPVRVAVAPMTVPHVPQVPREEFDATAYALALRHAQVDVGALVLLCTDPDGLTEEDLRLVHAVAEAAAGLLLALRAESAPALSAQELRDAIEGRVLIERATGVIGERFGIGMGAAREMLTVAAGSSGRPLAVVAREVLGRRRAVRVRPFRS